MNSSISNVAKVRLSSTLFFLMVINFVKQKLSMTHALFPIEIKKLIFLRKKMTDIRYWNHNKLLMKISKRLLYF